MDVLNYKLNKERNLYFIKNKRLKSVIIWFMYYIPLDNNASKNAMLSRLILKGSEKYKTNREVSKYLYSNYGATMGVDINLKGEVYTIGFYVNFVNGNLNMIDKNLNNNMLNFLNEILFNPLLENGLFRQDYFEVEKQNIISSIESKINNKDAYAFDRCIELMCDEEPYGIDKLGKKEWVVNMENKDVVDRYYKIISKAPLNVYVMGNLDFEEIKNSIQSVFRFEEGEHINIENKKRIVKDVREHVEEMDINQGKLCLGFRSDIDLNHADFPSFVVMNKLFGGGPQSKLFMEIREKESLCYSIYSALEKHKSLLFVACGIDSDKRDLVKNSIINILNQIRDGRFTEDELKNAVTSSQHNLKTIKDSNYTLLSYIQGLNIYKCNYTLDDLIENLKFVKKEDVIRCSQRINLDTVYFLGRR
jgi:predicted Zn-dependent peptidase